jgi:hypothetical protein
MVAEAGSAYVPTGDYDASFGLRVVTAFAWFCEIVIEEEIVEECVEQHPVFERVP